MCKAHKQWISEVRSQLLINKLGYLFKSWVLYVKYRNVKNYLRFKKCKNVLKSWKTLVVEGKNRNKKAFVHWYIRLVHKTFSSWTEFYLNRKEKWVKKVKADKKYYERLYAKVFLYWKHAKALEKASYIPLRISTKTVIIKKNGNIQEKSHLDIKIIKN